MKYETLMIHRLFDVYIDARIELKYLIVT